MNITNKTRITITNIRTGTTTTLLNLTTNMTSAIVTGNVVAGIPFVDAIDDSLDSCVIQLKNMAQRNLFKPYDYVQVTIYDGLKSSGKNYCVLFDEVQSYSRLKKTYVHNLSLIEPTKILEKIKIFNLNLTNQNDDFKTQFNKALANAEPVFYNIRDKETIYRKGNRLFIKSGSDLSTFLENKESRDFYFSNTDLRSVLDEMLGAYNARIVVDSIKYDDNGNIEYLYLNCRNMTLVTNQTAKWEKEEQGELIFERAENDGQNYAGTILARGKNSISDEVLVIKDIPRAQEATISNTTSTLFLPFPISDKGIKSLRVELPISYKLQSTDNAEISDTLYKIIYVDLTGYFMPQENYDLLSEGDSRKKIPYKIGQKVISLGKTYKNFLGFQNLSLLEVFKSEAEKVVENVLPSNAIDITYPSELKDLVFEVKYYPIYDTVVSISKPNIYDADDLLMATVDSQTEQTLDIKRHGEKLAGLIKRTANAEYYLDVKAKYYSKLLPLMSKINLPGTDNEEERGYVVYKREYSLFDNFINCRYYLSKDYNAVQQNAGVNREKHLYDIPLESSETPVMVKNYLIFSTTAPKESTSGFSSDVPYAAIQTLFGENKLYLYGYEGENNELWFKGQLKYLFFKSTNMFELKVDDDETVEVIEVFPQNTDIGTSENFPYEKEPDAYFMLPIGAYAVDKTMTFVAAPLDNYSVGYSRTGYVFSLWGDGGWKISHNRYVSKKEGHVGETNLFELNYIFDYLYYDTATGLHVVPQSSPIIDIKSDDCESYSAMNLNLTVEYYKDRTQTPLFVFALECVPSKADYGNIIIGPEFARKNNLVMDNGSGLTGLKLYTSTTYTFNGDEKVLPNGYSEDYLEVSNAFKIVKYTNDAALVVKQLGSSSAKSWAIADGNKNIYLAVNGPWRNIYATVANFPN